MEDAGLHFAADGKNSQMQIKKKHTHSFKYPRGSIQGTVRNTLRKLSRINGAHKY